MASYRLTVGQIANIEMGTTSVTTNFGSNDKFNVVMTSLTYSKKIFAPSEINAVLSITAESTSTTFPTMSDLQNTFSRRLVKLEYGADSSWDTVAENFFVFKMKPAFSKASSTNTAGLTVELIIYSLDKLLTIDKYCNAFTARKLGDVFLNELTKFAVSGKTVDGELNLQILNYPDSSSSTNVEVRQPYMVQYNETFYDFLARYASRCGEFLYFEGGKLHLGMPANLTTAKTDQMEVAQSVDYEENMEQLLKLEDRHYKFFDYGEDDDNRYVDSTFEVLGKFQKTDDPETTGTVAEGTVTVTTTSTYEGGKLVKSEVTTYYTENEKTEADKVLKGLPKSVVVTITKSDNDSNKISEETHTVTYKYSYDETNAKYLTDEKGDYIYTTQRSDTKSDNQIAGVYHQPEPSDAYFKEVEKDGCASFSDEWFDFRNFVFSDLFLRLMNSTTLYDCIADFLFDEAGQMKDAKVSADTKNKENNESNLTLTTTDNPDQTDGSTFNLFSTLSSKIVPEKLNVNKTGDVVALLAADFYSKMRLSAAVVSRVVVTLSYGENHQSLHLGDVIKVNNEFFIVKQIDMADNSYTVEAIPLFYQELSTDQKSINSAIPCPPLMPDIPTVRTSEPQVAFVEYNFDPNKLGRVRVRYPWQSEDGDCSPWVRMATPFATNGGGVSFKPDTGDEVLLNYEDGNIERPYIVGSLQSPRVTDHWGSLKERGIQSKNGHSITFDDASGMGFFTGMVPGIDFIKSCIPIVNPILDFQNLNDLTGGIKITDRYGLYKIDLSSDGRAVTIESALGNIDLNAFTGISISAPNGNIEIKGKNISIAASNKLSLESGSAVSDRFINKEGFTSLDGFKKSLVGIGTDVLDRTLYKLIDLSFLRTMVEVFTRPVDGTLKIRSNTYLLIEAGQGSAQIPRDDFRVPDREAGRGNEFVADQPLLMKLEKAIGALTSTADTICGAIKTTFEECQAAEKAYKAYKIGDVAIYDKLTKMKVDGTDGIVSKVNAKKSDSSFDITTIIKETDFGFDDIDEFKFKTKDKTAPEEPEQWENEPNEDYMEEWFKWKTDKANFDKDKEYDMVTVRKRRNDVIERAQELGNKLKAFFDAVGKWKDFNFDAVNQKEAYYTPELMTSAKGRDIFDKFISNAESGTVDLSKDISTGYDGELTKLHRALVYDLINEAKDADGYKDMFGLSSGAAGAVASVTSAISGGGSGGQEPDFGDEKSWKEFADKIGEPSDDISSALSTGTRIRQFFKSNFKEKWLDDWIDATHANPLSNQHKWTAPESGRILLSDKAGRTLHFDADQMVTNHNFGDVTTAHPVTLQRMVNSVK